VRRPPQIRVLSGNGHLELSGLFQQHCGRFLGLAREDRRRAGAQDAGFLGGHFGDGVAQLAMVERDRVTT